MPLIEETQSGSTTSILNAYALGADGVRERYSAPLGSYYSYTFDPMGNPVRRETQSAAEGNEDDVSGYYAVSTSEFDGYGDETADLFDNSGGAVSSSQHVGVGYAGEWGSYTDPETGLLSLGHRYYDPGTGRFVSRDPIGYAGGDNLYTYAGNNPVNNFDPQGTDCVNVLANGSAGVGDVVSFGLTGRIRQWLGADSIVDKSSGAYVGGEVAGAALSFVDAGAGAVGAVRAIRAAGGIRAVAGTIRFASAGRGLVAGARTVRTIAKGESLASLIAELQELTFSDGVEHAIVITNSGNRVLVSGGEAGIDFAKGSIKRILIHTHPYHLVAPSGPSAEDAVALGRLAQKSGSYVFDRGRLFKFYSNGKQSEITGQKLNSILNH